MENQENNNGQLQIELKEEVAQGTYANLAIITHSSSEFILDFIRVMPGMPKAGVQSRIVLAPEHAKRLLRALEENIGKYERAFGLIRMPDEQTFPPLPNIKGVKNPNRNAKFLGCSSLNKGISLSSEGDA